MLPRLKHVLAVQRTTVIGLGPAQCSHRATSAVGGHAQHPHRYLIAVSGLRKFQPKSSFAWKNVLLISDRNYAADLRYPLVSNLGNLLAYVETRR